MKRIVREGGFAFLAWLLPFAVAMCLSPLKQSYLSLFESLMGVTLAASTVFLGCLYLRGVNQQFPAHGSRIGLTWMVANWLLDWPMFAAGPMKMTLANYVMNIGVAYFMIPVITIGLGLAAHHARKCSTFA